METTWCAIFIPFHKQAPYDPFGSGFLYIIKEKIISTSSVISRDAAKITHVDLKVVGCEWLGVVEHTL